MKMNGNDNSELYPLARTVLLDALSALREHANAVIIVGAQAIYMHTGDADLALAPYTADADLAVNPAHLSDDPTIAQAMIGGGFLAANDRLGTWEVQRKLNGSPVTMSVDLLVPSTVAGGGRRGARLGVHGERVARHAKGLEGALVDCNNMRVVSLEPERDNRVFEPVVAGPGGLLIAKLHKIADRTRQPGRLGDKDALDVWRLLRVIEGEDLAERLTRLRREEVSAAVTIEALTLLRALFGKPAGQGVAMLLRATEGLKNDAETSASCVALANELLDALGL